MYIQLSLAVKFVVLISRTKLYWCYYNHRQSYWHT